MVVRTVEEPVDAGIRRQGMVFQALTLLMPYDVPGTAKIRVGAFGDGGYVLLDRLRPAQLVMSFGVGPSVSFEQFLAERGHPVLMFDHTVDSVPGTHPRFTWYKEGISEIPRPDEAMFTLEQHLQKVRPDESSMILKMDVEGWEWGVLANTPPAELRRFEQITLELHDLHTLDQPDHNAAVQAALRRLTADFTIFHVHANNFSPPQVLCGFPVPDGLEISCVRTDLVARAPSQTYYPTPLDRPNYEHWPELPLWYFPFMPGSHAAEMKVTLDA